MQGLDWAQVNPGSAMLGSNDRSILRGGMGPRHQVKISKSFKITKNPVPAKIAADMIKSGEAEVASESEWAVSKAQGLIHADLGCIEILADSASNYWGKPCDGRPWTGDGEITTRRVRIWSERGVLESTRPIEIADSHPLRLVRRESKYSETPIRLPRTGDAKKILKQEAVICLATGVLPSFIWAWFNASPGYISEGWLGLVMGGVFLGLSTAILWRPKTPTYIQTESGWKFE
ncbi:MAG: hypothetical protein CBD52_001015 [Euryarchaeota archaeon TMED192]|nr:MAG: hypothetical protein CBD52_001015 [Euryarchaeota archaeon TMED192]